MAEIAKTINDHSEEVIQAVGYKAGTASVIANVSLAASIKAGMIVMVDTWTLSDTAIVVSMCVSIMFFFKLHADWRLSRLSHDIKELEKKELENKE
jgi:hypothetical protein